MKTTTKGKPSTYLTVRAEEEQLVLTYMHGTEIAPPGLTTRQVANGTGLDDLRACRVLERLYVHRLVGRQKSFLGDHTTYWTVQRPIPPLELRGPPDVIDNRTPCDGCGRLCFGRRCSSCRFKGVDEPDEPPWADLSKDEVTVMLLIDCYGDRGLPFAKTALFSRDAERAIQGLQRRGIAGVDLQGEVWRFGVTGRALCDDYKLAHQQGL